MKMLLFTGNPNVKSFPAQLIRSIKALEEKLSTLSDPTEIAETKHKLSLLEKKYRFCKQSESKPESI